MLRLIYFLTLSIMVCISSSCSTEYRYQQSVYVYAPRQEIEEIIFRLKESSTLTGSISQTTDPFSKKKVKVIELYNDDGLLYLAQASKDTCDKDSGKYDGTYFSNVFVVNLSSKNLDGLQNLSNVIQRVSHGLKLELYKDPDHLCSDVDIAKMI